MQAYRITHVRVVTMSSLFWLTSQNCRHPTQECCVLEALGVGYFFKHEISVPTPQSSFPMQASKKSYALLPCAPEPSGVGGEATSPTPLERILSLPQKHWPYLSGHGSQRRRPCVVPARASRSHQQSRCAEGPPTAHTWHRLRSTESTPLPPVTRNRTRDHLIAAMLYSQMLYQLSYSRLARWPIWPTGHPASNISSFLAP